MNLAQRFDGWVQTGPFTPESLGIFRIVYAVCLLLTVRDITWLSQYPNSLYHAPPGPFMLLSGFPPTSVLVALEIALSAALVLLGLGVFTRFASAAVSLLLLVTFGLTYTLGKIDHTVLVVLAPAILLFAKWGDRFSVDALRHPPVEQRQPQWPLRYLAFCIGLGFLASVIVKAAGGIGYLDVSTQSVRGWFLAGTVTGYDSWLSGIGIGLKSAAAWEIIDWFTVILELGIFFAVLSWRAFRLMLAAASVFHLGVFLVFGIIHTTELIVYGAFVSWGAILASPALRPVGRALRTSFAAVAGATLLIGFAIYRTWIILTARDWIEDTAGIALLFIGAFIGITYLIVQLRLFCKHDWKSPSDTRVK